jgi:hypothetical protein
VCGGVRRWAGQLLFSTGYKESLLLGNRNLLAINQTKCVSMGCTNLDGNEPEITA